MNTSNTNNIFTQIAQTQSTLNDLVVAATSSFQLGSVHQNTVSITENPKRGSRIKRKVPKSIQTSRKRAQIHRTPLSEAITPHEPSIQNHTEKQSEMKMR